VYTDVKRRLLYTTYFPYTSLLRSWPHYTQPPAPGGAERRRTDPSPGERRSHRRCRPETASCLCFVKASLLLSLGGTAGPQRIPRSEERRVGKERMKSR